MGNTYVGITLIMGIALTTHRTENPVSNTGLGENVPLKINNKIKVIFVLYCIVLYCIVLYCIEGVVIAAQCTAAFLRSIVIPRI